MHALVTYFDRNSIIQNIIQVLSRVSNATCAENTNLYNWPDLSQTQQDKEKGKKKISGNIQ